MKVTWETAGMSAPDTSDGCLHEPAGPSAAGAVAEGQTQPVRAKLFPNGRSQAVRLPKAFRLPGNEVLVHREGRRVILEPIEDPPRDVHGWPLGLWDRLAELRRELTDDDYRVPPDPPPPAGELDRLFDTAGSEAP
jgi:antitoxin VapB